MTDAEHSPGVWNGQPSHGAPVEIVQIDALFPADSPRIKGENDEHVRLLAELDNPLPPIVVHRETMRVVDGMHRVGAARLRRDTEIHAVFFDGTEQEAFVLAVRLNVVNGLPLSLADRTAAALRILVIHPHWSDRAIAAVAGVSPKTVGAIRRRSSEEIPHSNGRVGRDGRVRSVDPAVGRRRACEVISARPDASLREVAAEAGIAVATAREVRKRIRLGRNPVPQQRSVPRPEGAPLDEQPVAVNGPLVLENLKQDPSLRLNELGRIMLRLLNVHSISPADWDRFIASVPPHCVRQVAQAARECAVSWEYFAEGLERRGNSG